MTQSMTTSVASTVEIEPLAKLEPYAPLFFGLMFALPTLLAGYPPMTDLPLHESIIGVLRHWGDPKYFPPDLYILNLGHPNQLFYFLALPFSYVVGTTWALKIVVAGTQLGLYLAAARFAKYVGTPRWTALLVGPLGLGWLYYWGLIANLLGLACFLAVVPVLDAFVVKPTLRGGLLSFASLLLLYFAHETVMLCACLMVGLFALGRGIFSLGFVARLAPAVAAMAVAFAEFLWGQSMRPPANAAIPTLFHPWRHKWEIIPGALFAGYEVLIRTLMFAIAAIAIVLFAIERFRERPRIRGTKVRELWNRYRFEIFAGALFAMYLALPFTLGGATLFYHRFLPPAYAVLAVVVAPQAAGAMGRRLPRLVAAVTPVGSLLIAWPSFPDANKVFNDFDQLVDRVEYRSAYIVVDVGPKVPARLFNQGPLEGHIVARRGGRDLFDFTASVISPAFLNPRHGWNEPYWRLQVQPALIRPEHDLNRFRYVFLHTTIHHWGELAETAFAPDAKLIGQEGEWWLFESTHVKYDITAPDEDLPEPRPHTLRKRVKDVERREKGLPIPPDPLLPAEPTEPEPQPQWSPLSP
jgi:hypothetical protein